MKTILTFCLLLAISSSSIAQLLATPTATGPGKNATGGRGGVILQVTNLNNTGAGSYRDAVQASGARNIIFKVGGTILLTSPINVNLEDSLCTVMGETAPGDGIQISGDFHQWKTHNSIITGMRFRPGDDVGGSHSDPTNRDGFFFGGTASNVQFQHNSVAGGTDELIWLDDNADLITIQDCFLGEPYNANAHLQFTADGGHGKGPAFTRVARVGMYNTYLHSFGYDRNPQLRGAPGVTQVELINILSYNYGNYAATLDDSGEYIILACKWVLGPDSDTGIDEKPVISGDTTAAHAEPTALYAQNNIGPDRLTNVGEQWYPEAGVRFIDMPKVHAGRTYYSPYPPFAMFSDNYRVRDVETMDAHILRWAGAILPDRDDMDARWIAEYRALTGAIPNGTSVRTLFSPTGSVWDTASNSTTKASFNVSEETEPNRYNGLSIEFLTGPGSTATRTVTGTLSPGGGMVATVTWAGALDAAPTSGTTYRIHQTIIAPVAPLPVLADGADDPDTDGGGIPDRFEVMFGLNINVATDDDDLAPDGYSYVEKWRDLLYTLYIPQR